jgi:hypothetical protein
MTNTQTPVQIDTELASLYNQAAKAESRVDYVWEQIHRASGDKQVWQYGTRVWTLTNDQALIALVNKIDAGLIKSDLIADLKAAKAVLKGINAQIEVLDAIFTASPWSRFFIVQNNNGHIHSNMRCSTCYATTQFGWNPQLSGKSEAEAVAELGEILCTVCFPSAPVAWTAGISKAAQVSKDERAAKKAAKAPVFIAERVSLGDYHRGPFKTQRAAEQALVQHLAAVKWYDYLQEDVAGVNVILSRLAEVGVTREQIEARVEAKHIRDTKAAAKHAKRLGLI